MSAQLAGACLNDFIVSCLAADAYQG